MEISKVGVVGCGLMGHGITQICAQAGWEVVVRELDSEKLDGGIAKIEKQDIEVHGRDVLKTVPRGYPADHTRVGLLRYKGLIAWREWPPEPWLETAEAKDRIAGFLRAARPLRGWLDAQVGPSTMDRPPR